MREKLLFVTRGDESYDDGFSYVIELAKTLDAGINILMIYEKRMFETFEDDMAAVAFAEVGEFKTAREILDERQQRIKRDAEKKITELTMKYQGYSVEISYQVGVGDIVSNTRDIIEKKPTIDLVLLSPNLINKSVINVKKLFRNISRPIVTMSRSTKG
ncbi:MAG: hypothetical protein AB1488_08655 [Nitrospirota bacterium]